MTQHAIQRAKERLGIDVTFDDLNATLALLGKDARAILVERRGDIARWVAPLADTLAGLVVSSSRGRPRIITVMRARDIVMTQRRMNLSNATRAMKRRGAWHPRRKGA